ncbi:MAG TPA: hypothetical protein VK524_21280 [Polyangiaceae bacterium]|nr:hypothetical protein [Polyangiaceae bacterium]
MRGAAFCSALILVCGCAALAERPSRDGERKPSDTDSDSDAGAGAATAIDEDDGQGVPPTTSAAPGEVTLTFEQASCLGLTQAACAGCHRRGDGFVLRPIGVPPGPPGTPTVANGECVDPGPARLPDAAIPPVEERPTPDTPIDPAVEQVLSDEQAMCIGLDQVVCTSCHRRQDSFLLKPRGLPPHPGTATALLERCL